MGIDSERLRHRVDFEKRVNKQDPVTGEIVPAWVKIFESVPAAIEPLSSREYLAAAAVQSEVTTKIIVRLRAGLTPAQRIVHGRTCCKTTVGLEIYNPSKPLRDKESGLEYVTIPCSLGVDQG